MITVENAFSLIQENRLPLPLGSAFVENPSNLETTEPLLADRPSPPFHRVMMDGIGVSWEAYANGRREFRVAGVCPAGSPAPEISTPDTCFEVMTGASLPTNAELVIPYEQIELSGGFARVTSEASRTRFENVHLQGSDCKQGAVVLEAGQKLNGPHWGIAASFGHTRVAVKAAPRIQLISTGDELVDVEQMPLDFQIRRSNAHALKASLLQNNFPRVDLYHLPDEEEAIREHYEKFAPDYDVLFFSGGVSKGKFDYLPRIFSSLGVKKVFHGVRQRPGKPLWFGVDEARRTNVFGLPGNPVSSLVCLHRYFIPARTLYARLSRPLTFAKDLTLFVPVKLECLNDSTLVATPLSIKNSGEFTALAGSDGFLELPSDKNEFLEGESYRFYNWGSL